VCLASLHPFLYAGMHAKARFAFIGTTDCQIATVATDAMHHIHAERASCVLAWCCGAAGDVLRLGDGKLADGSVKPFYLKEGQTVSTQQSGQWETQKQAGSSLTQLLAA
jgi:hypothetical protein